MADQASGRARVQLKHLGGLDGLRGLAVIAVILYHGGVPWLGGGFLGVELFFVLSGFLITSLLVTEWLDRGAIALTAFWGRRARRLLPALILLIVAIGLYYAIAGPAKAVPGMFGDGLAALFYYSNWHQIAAATNYFATSGPVSPFQHTWSLAIEEQFYAVWPLLVLGVFGAVSRKRRPGGTTGALGALLGVTVAGIVASAVASALLFDGGSGLDRVYYGTDTRASGLLSGAALAIWLALVRARTDRPGAATDRGVPLVRWAAPAAMALVILAMRVASGSSGWLFPWGLLGVDLATVLVIASVVLSPGSAIDRVLSLAPLQATGRISYGLYLWHFPLFLWLDTETTGLSGVRLLAFRVAVTVLVSVLSYHLVEQPIRRRRRPTWWIGWLAPVGAGGAVASLLVASAVGSEPAVVPAADTLPAPPAKLAGKGPACSMRLTDTTGYGVAAIPASREAPFEYASLGSHTLTWSGSTQASFTTCPPKRILLIGDSLAFTIGVPMLGDEASYGVEVANAAILGCAFSTRGQLDVDGVWETPDDGCPDALTTWSAEEREFHPAEVVVELGYRDEFDWRWNGTVEHLGDAAFDAYLQQQMDEYVRVLGRDGTRILFLSVPYTDPPAQSNGSPNVAASATRHALVNKMLAKAAATDPGRASVFDIDSVISPSGHYDAKVNGQVCRFDGIHFSVYCGELLERKILPAARALLKR